MPSPYNQACAKKSRQNVLMVDLTLRNSLRISSGLPVAFEGSGNVWCILEVAEGKYGHCSFALSQTLITVSIEMLFSSLTCFEVWCEISTPSSFITWIAVGLTPWVSTPALYTIVPSGAKRRRYPSAIWLLHELPVHKTKTVFMSLVIMKSFAK